MNQSKFSIADVLTILGALGFGFFCFLSINFLTLGNLKSSIIWAVALAFIIGGVAFAAKLFKRTTGNFKTSFIFEVIFLMLYVIVAVLFIFPFSHYFVVSSEKEEIKKELLDNIEQAENMFTEYEAYVSNRMTIYESKLKSVVKNKETNKQEYKDFGFVEGTSDETQINNNLFKLEATLYPSNYEDIKSISNNWLSDSKGIITSWKPIGIPNVLVELKSNINNWKDQLIDISTYRAKGENVDDFSIDLTFNSLTYKFTNLGKPSPLSILIAIIFYLVMILSYLVTNRHTRWPGLNNLFTSGGKLDNEL